MRNQNSSDHKLILLNSGTRNTYKIKKNINTKLGFARAEEKAGWIAKGEQQVETAIADLQKIGGLSDQGSVRQEATAESSQTAFPPPRLLFDLPPVSSLEVGGWRWSPQSGNFRNF